MLCCCAIAENVNLAAGHFTPANQMARCVSLHIAPVIVNGYIKHGSVQVDTAREQQQKAHALSDKVHPKGQQRSDKVKAQLEDQQQLINNRSQSPFHTRTLSGADNFEHLPDAQAQGGGSVAPSKQASSDMATSGIPTEHVVHNGGIQGSDGLGTSGTEFHFRNEPEIPRKGGTCGGMSA